MKQLEEYTKRPWLRGISTESVTEDKGWGFLFYQSNWSKRKQGGILKADETVTSTINFDTKYCAALLRRIIMGTTALVENCNRSQFLGYYQLNQYLCACLKLLKKQRYAVQSVIYTEMIKYESVCMPTKIVHSRKVKDAKSAYKENITSDITPYQLVGGIQRIKEALWERNNKCKKYSLDGLGNRMCFLMNKRGILCCICCCVPTKLLRSVGSPQPTDKE